MRVGITAGPTREFLDPIRFLSNTSTGKMGYALAQVFREKNHRVYLISGPVSLSPPKGCELTFVQSSHDMLESVMHIIADLDVFIMTAAVCDYMPKTEHFKIKKSKQTSTKTLSLNLLRTSDILKSIAKISHHAFVVGFSAETDDLIENSRQKLIDKHLDMIVANPISSDSGFSSDFNSGFFLFSDPNRPDKEVKKCSKIDFAYHIFHAIYEKVAG